MKLLTQEVRDAFKSFPLYSQDGKGDDALVVAKFFDPVGRYTFYATEGGPESTALSPDDFIVFGWCVSSLGPDCDEWGYASVIEMQNIPAVPVRFGLGIERDIHYVAGSKTVGEVKSRHYQKEA